MYKIYQHAQATQLQHDEENKKIVQRSDEAVCYAHDKFRSIMFQSLDKEVYQLLYTVIKAIQAIMISNYNSEDKSSLRMKAELLRLSSSYHTSEKR